MGHKNWEVRKEHRRQYYLAHRDEILSAAKLRYATDPEYRLQQKERAKRRQASNPEAHRRASRKTDLKRYYGLTPEGYSTLLSEHGCKCVICSSGQNLGVDHNHVTGMIRGILCSNCNRALGFAKDSIEVLSLMVSYLEERDGKSQLVHTA